MNQEMRRSRISRRSVLRFFGAGSAARTLGKLCSSSGAAIRAVPGLFFSAAAEGKNDGPTFTVSKAREVTYTSGGMSYVETIQSGHWVGRHLLASFGSPANSAAQAEDAFLIVVKDTPSSQRGTTLSSGWQLASAVEVPGPDSRAKHAVVKLSNAELPVLVEVHTLLDGTPVFQRWLTITNQTQRPLASH